MGVARMCKTGPVSVFGVCHGCHRSVIKCVSANCPAMGIAKSLHQIPEPDRQDVWLTKHFLAGSAWLKRLEPTLTRAAAAPQHLTADLLQRT